MQEVSVQVSLQEVSVFTQEVSLQEVSVQAVSLQDMSIQEVYARVYFSSLLESVFGGGVSLCDTMSL